MADRPFATSFKQPPNSDEPGLVIGDDNVVYLIKPDGSRVTVGGGVGVATVTLTNAQILALPTAPVQLVAAPGAGRTLLPIAILLAKSFAAGAYTNIDAAAKLTVAYGPLGWQHGGTTMGRIYESNYTFFGGAVYETYTMPNGAIEDGNGGSFPAAGADLRNLSFAVSAQNGVLGDFTDGDAANTITVTVYYAVV